MKVKQKADAKKSLKDRARQADEKAKDRRDRADDKAKGRQGLLAPDVGAKKSRM